MYITLKLWFLSFTQFSISSNIDMKRSTLSKVSKSTFYRTINLRKRKQEIAIESLHLQSSVVAPEPGSVVAPGSVINSVTPEPCSGYVTTTEQGILYNFIVNTFFFCLGQFKIIHKEY